MTTENNSYQWTGLNEQGKRVDGILQAADMRDAQIELTKMGIEVISLQPKKSIQFFASRKNKKIKPRDILLFTRFLSTMLSAGLPIVQALDIIGQDQENPAMKVMIGTIKSKISEGKTLAESFSLFPDHFSQMYCSLIKAGEKSGTIDKILLRLANYLERSEGLKRKIKKAMVYPAAVLSVALIVSLILLIFVVPQFQAMFESFGARLPAFTRMIVSLSDFIRSYWWVILFVIGAIIVGLRHLSKTDENFNLMIDRLSLKLYIVGPVLKKGVIARFTRTLSTTLDAGMPIVESMKGMPQIMGNRVYSEAVQKICNEVISGHQLSVAMASTNLFPNMAIQMISVGEASGRLGEMLNKVADYYEEEVNTIVDNLSSLLEPLIMMVLGVIVGSFVIAMYLPIFKIGSLF